MAEQNYSNHARFVPAFHFFLFGLLVLGFIGSLVNLFHSMGEGSQLYDASLISLILFCLLLMFVFMRVFPLKAQDRAIRAEENFRHYLMTGKPLDARLDIKQIIALRFASDGEYVALAGKAASESMKPDDIKKAVKNWRGDYYRA